MKKHIIALAAFTALAASAQTTIVAEYDYHKTVDQNVRSGYYALGAVRSTSVGNFDAYLQGVKSTVGPTGFVGPVQNPPATTLNFNGWELGYSYYVPLKSFSVTPRIASGVMANSDLFGSKFEAKYVLASVEASYTIKPGLSTYVGASHMHGLNDDSVRASNRVQAGVDYSVTPQTTVRLGGSQIRGNDTIQNGIVTMVFYSF